MVQGKCMCKGECMCGSEWGERGKDGLMSQTNTRINTRHLTRCSDLQLAQPTSSLPQPFGLRLRPGDKSWLHQAARATYSPENSPCRRLWDSRIVDSFRRLGSYLCRRKTVPFRVSCTENRLGLLWHTLLWNSLSQSICEDHRNNTHLHAPPRGRLCS